MDREDLYFIRKGELGCSELDEDLSQQQEDFFKNSKIRDEKGNLLVCYHGTETPGFKEFDARKGKSQFGDYKFDNYNINYFTTNKETAIGYTDLGYEHDNNVYACYLNVVNPYIVNNETKDDMLRTWHNIKDRKIRDKEILYFERFYDKWKTLDKDVDAINKDMFFFNCKFVPNEDDDKYYDLISLNNNTLFGANHPIMYAYSLEEYFDDDQFEEFRNALVGDYQGEDREYFNYTIDNLIRWVLLMNEEDNTNYDGIIIPEIYDIGPKGSPFMTGKTTDIVTLKSSNQIKRIDNLNPTSSNNIDEDLKDDEIISIVEKEIGTTDRPIDGPSYVMPNGRFLTIWRSKIPVSKYSRTGSATHSDVQDFLYDKGLVKHKGIDVDWPKLEELGCIRVNSGFEEYIWLPKIKPNESQWQSLLMWLDWYFRFHDKLTVGYREYAPKIYYAKDYTTDEILKKCKEAYVRGYLTEKIVKLDNGKWQVQSEDGSKNLGTYNTKKEAEKRLKQVHYFKHMNEDLKWNYKEIGKEIVSSLQELSYWDNKSLDPYVYLEDWEQGCDIEATYYDENDLEVAWLVLRVYQDRQAITFRQIDVYENSGFRNTGLGKALVERVLRALPKETKILVHMDMSGGFWYHMTQTFNDYDWDKSLHEDLLESKQDIEKFKQWAGDELADRFFAVKNRLKGELKDIYYWISLEKKLGPNKELAHQNALDSLEYAITDVEVTPTKKERQELAKNGSEKIYEDERWLVLKINSFEASVKYGKHTQWCITGTNSGMDGGRSDWNYHSDNDMYFFIDKQKDTKYALEFKDMHNWCLYNDQDYVEVGEGDIAQEAVNVLGDPWSTEYDSHYPAFPKIEGLPDLQQAYKDVIAEEGADEKSIKVESLNEDVNKYYRLEIEDRFGDRAGLWTGAFELIPTKSTIEDYPEDFEDLTPDERRRYYQFDYLLNQLSKIKSPGIDTNFNGLRENDIFAFTSNKYVEIKDIINEMKQVLKELGFKLIIKELDVDDIDISYRDSDQIAFSKSISDKEVKTLEDIHK